MEQPIIKEDDRPLYHAARLGDVEQVDALIERGIHADERDEVLAIQEAILHFVLHTRVDLEVGNSMWCGFAVWAISASLCCLEWVSARREAFDERRRRLSCTHVRRGEPR